MAVNLQHGQQVQVFPELLGYQDHPGKVTNYTILISRLAETVISGLMYMDYRCAL